MQTLPQLDATLARLQGARQAMAQRLLDLDADATRKLLETAKLTGTTADRVGAALKAAGMLWQNFSLLGQVLDQATDLRGTGHRVPPERMTELERLLLGPSIILPPQPTERGETPPTATTPDLVLDGMDKAFAACIREFRAVDTAWRDLLPRLESAQREVEELGQLARELGEAADPSLIQAHQRVNALTSNITNDPLSIDPATVEGVVAALRPVSDHLQTLIKGRDELDEDLAAAGLLIDEVERLLDLAEDAAEESLSKILAPQGLLACIDRACISDERRGLRPWLARLIEVAKDDRWRPARRGLDEWKRVGDATLAAARRVYEANSAPLNQRDELRGRLDAFRAKAARLGYLEDPRLSELYRQARDLLYTAPCDLAQAAERVAAYGAAMAAGGGGAR